LGAIGRIQLLSARVDVVPVLRSNACLLHAPRCTVLRRCPEAFRCFSRMCAVAIEANVQIDMPYGGGGDNEPPAFKVVADKQPGQPSQPAPVECHGSQYGSKVCREDVLMMKTFDRGSFESAQNAP